jgi:SNF2 family DNA or RNA helicase
MAEFTRLRQICGTTANVGARDDSASLDELETLAKDHLYGDHKFFVVSPYRTTARCAYERLKKLKFRCVYVDGTINGREAAKLRKKFQTDSRIKAYVGTIDANREALTLTAADYAIFIGRSLVQKLNEQTEDRLHRHGQEKSVNVINIINRDSIEENIEEKILLPKARLFSEMIDGLKSDTLSFDQIRRLL